MKEAMKIQWRRSQSRGPGGEIDQRGPLRKNICKEFYVISIIIILTIWKLPF
jgi:hypothetical protein